MLDVEFHATLEKYQAKGPEEEGGWPQVTITIRAEVRTEAITRLSKLLGERVNVRLVQLEPKLPLVAEVPLSDALQKRLEDELGPDFVAKTNAKVYVGADAARRGRPATALVDEKLPFADPPNEADGEGEL